MKTSRSQKDPLMPTELAILLGIIAIGLIAGAFVPVIVTVINHFKH